MASDVMKTVKKVDNKKPKKKEKKANIFVRLGHYFREVVAELKRVTWPDRKGLISATGAVIVFVVVMSVITGLLDGGFGTLMKLFYKA